jgi:hypothetical protein
MKRFFSIIALSIFVILRVGAQDDRSNRILQFVYISFDESTDTQKLSKRLSGIYDNAMDYPELYSTIFYMPNGTAPTIVKINLPGDNYKDFAKIISTIQQQPSNIVMGEYDVSNILNIFAQDDIVDENGRPIYRSVDWMYYICPSFWSMRNNELVIAKLFFAMEMSSLISLNHYLAVNIYSDKGSKELGVNGDEPFGNKALCRDTKLVIPLPY